MYEVTGIPENLTEQIIQSLRGADQWGSLLKVDEAVDRAISEFEANLGIKAAAVQTNMFEEVGSVQRALDFDAKRVKSSLLEMVESFLAKHTGGDDLGLRLRGQQLAAGVRFIRMVRESSYDLVIGNPPYNSAGKMRDVTYFQEKYPEGSPDLFAAFMIRSLQLVKPFGIAVNVTLSNWMYLGTYEKLREYLLDKSSILMISDLGKAAFTKGSMLINTSMNIFQRANQDEFYQSIVVRPFKPQDVIIDPYQSQRNENVLISIAILNDSCW